MTDQGNLNYNLDFLGTGTKGPFTGECKNFCSGIAGETALRMRKFNLTSDIR